MILSQMRGPSVTPARDECYNSFNLPTEQVNPTDSAWQPHKGDRTLMENTQEELKAHLMKTDEEFRHLAEQHAQYHKQLEALEAKSRLTPEEEVGRASAEESETSFERPDERDYQPLPGAARRLTSGALIVFRPRMNADGRRVGFFAFISVHPRLRSF